MCPHQQERPLRSRQNRTVTRADLRSNEAANSAPWACSGDSVTFTPERLGPRTWVSWCLSFGESNAPKRSWLRTTWGAGAFVNGGFARRLSRLYARPQAGWLRVPGVTRTAILNAFSPAHELTEPSKFAGRSVEIQELADALRVKGSVPVIYGDRGLGKSSTAIQVQLIALGDVELLSHIGAKQLSLSADETFLTVYVTCTDRVQSLEDLQKLILHKLQSIELVSEEQQEILQDRTTRRKISLKYFEHETTKRYKKRAGRLRAKSLSTEEQLERELSILLEAFSQPILIVIDELDRARKLHGLSQYLKSASSEDVKFMLVGIAQSLTELILDHASLTRPLYPVRIPAMKPGELADIVDKAVGALDAQGIQVDFHPSARKHLIELSGGFPWFTHALGQEALRAATDDRRTTVTRDDVIHARRSLTNNRFAQQFRDSYQKAVRDSSQREIVLRTFASWSAEDIPTSEVYAICRSLGVANPAVYRGHLVQRTFGEPLMGTGLQERGLVRFRNQMFKHYVELRSSIYEGIAERVEQATEKW